MADRSSLSSCAHRTAWLIDSDKSIVAPIITDAILLVPLLKVQTAPSTGKPEWEAYNFWITPVSQFTSGSSYTSSEVPYA